ncbi:hypothetical protein [Cohnella sp. GCM10027633]|uniref:hypothetical protein n=1 Tax=unclassified Cohnella TaxID=2636738 RepID=UPI00362ACAC8
MPDWSYQTLFRPLLFRMPARAARRATLAAFGAVGRMPWGAFVIKTLGHQEPSPLLETGWSPTPVGLSGTIDPKGTARRGLARLGFGFIEIGPVTAEPIACDRPIVIDKERERIDYPDALENDGAEAIVRRIAAPGHDLPQYVRVSPMPESTSDDAERQLVLMLDKLTTAGAAGFYVDVYSGRHDRHPDASRLLSACAAWMQSQDNERRRPLFIFIPSEFPSTRMIELFDSLTLPDWRGIVIGGGLARDDGSAQDGVFLRDGALALVRLARSHPSAPEDWIVKAAAGAHEPADAIAFLEAGATAVLVGSGFVFSGPGLPKRINDAIVHERISDQPEPEPASFFRSWGWMYLLGLGMIVGGLAAWFVASTAVLLPYDERFLGATAAELRAFNGHLLHFMSHDRITLAGTMLSLGILYTQFAKHGMREGMHWARTAAFASCAVGFPSFLLYLGYGFFDPLHAAAAVALLPLFLLSLRRDKPELVDRSPASLINDKLWRRALWGQLCFVTLGGSLAVGGLTIAGVGILGVFVPSDLVFLGMTSEQLTAFNDKLVPLIAHDRAGFGGALFADAVALLAASLWGIQIGRRWLWRTLLFGGAPAFIAGLGIHFDIGYTDFVHLLPAWFAFGLYVAGLILLYPYMHVRMNRVD